MSLPTVLCVDDEPNVLHGLRRSLRGAFELYTAESGVEALRLLETGIDPAVVCSDMRMPNMDGAAFLAQVRQVAPDATRVLLSGQADIASLERVINGGGIFRFLVKPCERADLVAALGEAAEHHRLVRSERELLDGTVVGSVRLLTDALALASPEAFGRGRRVEQLVLQMSIAEGVELDWEARTAASVVCLGMLSVPPAVLEAVEAGRGTPAECALVAGMPAAGADLLDHIPRLQGVAAILRGVAGSHAGTWVVQTLRAALAFVAALQHSDGVQGALISLRGKLPARSLDTLWTLHTHEREAVVEVRSGELEEGMQLVEPVRRCDGVLLLPAGLVLTPSALLRLRNFGLRYGLQEPLRVRLPDALARDLDLVKPSAMAS